VPATNPLRHSGLLGAALVPAVLLAMMALGGCGERIEPAPQQRTASDPPGVPEPLLRRDLETIQRRGTLRLITFYSPRTYFIHRGGQAGFEFELASRFARKHNLTVEMVIAEPGDDLVSLLNTGRGDLVCVGQPPPPEFGQYAAWTRPTNFTRKVIVLPANESPTASLQDLAGMTLTLPHGCTFLPDLQQLRTESGVPFRIAQGPPLAEAEELMAQVARQEREALVVDDIAARAGMAWIPGLELGPAVGPRRPTVWLVRRNSPDLLAALDEFLEGHLVVTATGRTRRSQTYGIIHDRYFKNELTIRGYREAAHRPDKSGRISRFDELIRGQAEAAGLDWRLVAAQIFQESRFYPNARSKADARGLMQVLPEFAGEQADSLYDPAANLRAGLRLMKQTHRSFAYLDSLDRWRFTLAVYHAGYGHVTDARRLAMDLGRDPNAWQGSLAHTLPLLMEHRHFRNMRHGYYGGAETVDYVEEILNRFRMYARFVPRFPAPPDTTPGAAQVQEILPGLVREDIPPPR
jgi:membrane-bound lytic murein transglycosylase F